mmetsp:Transcript_8650/g.15321  ORF Transcript_8650/g.15321 Transcript_8650/m.15321 type:complete len:116 (-) Transcript_8650:81-428(-)
MGFIGHSYHHLCAREQIKRATIGCCSEEQTSPRFSTPPPPPARTGKECVRSVFPGARILENRVDSYPIMVTVAAIHPDGEETAVWSGSQKRLFRKYAQKRSTAMHEIKSALQSLL